MDEQDPTDVTDGAPRPLSEMTDDELRELSAREGLRMHGLTDTARVSRSGGGGYKDGQTVAHPALLLQADVLAEAFRREQASRPPAPAPSPPSSTPVKPGRDGNWHMRWTEDEVRQVREMNGQGLSDVAIALHLGRPEASVGHVRRRLGLAPVKGPRPWMRHASVGPKTRAEAVRLYREGWSLGDVERTLRLAKSKARALLLEEGVVLRTISEAFRARRTRKGRDGGTGK